MFNYTQKGKIMVTASPNLETLNSALPLINIATIGRPKRPGDLLATAARKFHIGGGGEMLSQPELQDLLDIRSGKQNLTEIYDRDLNRFTSLESQAQELARADEITQLRQIRDCMERRDFYGAAAIKLKQAKDFKDGSSQDAQQAVREASLYVHIGLNYERVLANEEWRQGDLADHTSVAYRNDRIIAELEKGNAITWSEEGRETVSTITSASQVNRAVMNILSSETRYGVDGYVGYAVFVERISQANKAGIKMYERLQASSQNNELLKKELDTAMNEIKKILGDRLPSDWQNKPQEQFRAIRKAVTDLENPLAWALSDAINANEQLTIDMHLQPDKDEVARHEKTIYENWPWARGGKGVLATLKSSQTSSEKMVE